MATAKDIMTLAKSYLGVKEDPPDSNKVIFNTAYYGFAVHGVSYPWCATFVWYVFYIAKASYLFYDGKKTAYCPTIANWGKSAGLTAPINSGRYGDIVLFSWKRDGVADHVGFIESKNNDGSYTTIEGNTAIGNDSNGGEVMRRTRYQYQICEIIRPKYSEDKEMVTEQGYNDWKEYHKRYEDEVKKQGAAVGIEQTAQAWARETGISDGNQPQAPLKRWQLWAILKKFHEMIQKERN